MNRIILIIITFLFLTISISAQDLDLLGLWIEVDQDPYAISAMKESETLSFINENEVLLSLYINNGLWEENIYRYDRPENDIIQIWETNNEVRIYRIVNSSAQEPYLLHFQTSIYNNGWSHSILEDSDASLFEME